MQIPSGMNPCHQDLTIDSHAARGSTDELMNAREAATPASQQSRVTQTADAAPQENGAQQAAGSQGTKKEGGLQKLFAAIQKGVEQLLGLIPVLGNMLKSLLPKAGGAGGAST